MHHPTEIPSGTRIGRYTLRELLGKGASASVYMAHDKAGRPFAIKVRRRGQAAMDRRFLREFESMRLLRVSGVVPVHEAGIEEDILWFSMNRVYGKPFYAALHEEQYLIERIERAIALGRRLLEILASLHEAGFVHRDVKPSNVLVDNAGGVHVLDFGIGRYFTDHDTLSRSGEVLGTVPFMAPEQLAGLPSGEKVDLFAVGLMLHEAVAGKRQRPLTTVGWIPKICLERLPALATLYRECPLGLSHLVEQLLAVDPRDRPSAREAATALAEVVSGPPSQEWPEPVWVDPGDWFSDLENALGNPGERRHVWVLNGPCGSGRRRAAEQLHRSALLQGMWALNLRARVDEVGGPLLDLLEQLLSGFDDTQLEAVVGDGADVLRMLWPRLPLPYPRTTGEPSTGHVVDALAEVFKRASEQRPLLLIVHDVEHIDGLSSRVLALLAEDSTENLALLLLHESRWQTATSSKLVSSLARIGGVVIDIPPLTEAARVDIVRALCPEEPATMVAGTTPQAAVEVGLQALARWRDEELPPPAPSLWPLPVRSAPIPVPVYRALVGRRAESGPWVSRRGDRIALSGGTATRLARTRLHDLRKSAVALARTWHETLGRQADPGDLATLRLLAQDPTRAWEPAARAAIRAHGLGQHGEARRWLTLLETLRRPPRPDPELIFALARAHAQVTLRTDAVAREGPIDQAAAVARTAEHHLDVSTLRAEYSLRHGDVRRALVTALRVGSATTRAPPHIAVRALLVAIHCRIVLGQLPDAKRELERVDALLAERPHPLLAVRSGTWRAELAFEEHDLLWCRALCQKNIRQAQRHGYERGEAFAASRLGQVLRLLGRRREAEHHTRLARDAFAATGDVYLDAETGLALATLLVERGEVLGARQQLDDSIRRIRGLHLTHLLPTSRRLTLQIATLQNDPSEASLALDGLEIERSTDAELPAALIRWWRIRGDVERALKVAPPRRTDTYGHAMWRLERARAALVAGQTRLAAREASAGLDEATGLGFAELQVYGRVIGGVAGDVDEETWVDVQRRATNSMWTELYLGALEMEARRGTRHNDPLARTSWRTLLARSQELGYAPGVAEAEGWLGAEDPQFDEEEATTEAGIRRYTPPK